MKKYIFIVIALMALCIAFYGSSSYACTAMEVEQGLCNEGSTTSSDAESNPCKTLVTPSMGGTTCTLTPKQDQDACHDAGADGASSSSNKCSQRYSCETLFTDSDTANQCNLKRCQVQRGANSSYCQCKYVKKGIPLNTSIPFLGNCLEKTDSSNSNDTAALNAFPTIVSVATRILVTVIMLVGFIMIVVGGVQWSAGNAKEGKNMIKKVAIGFALLGTMGAILKLINPNFFK